MINSLALNIEWDLYLDSYGNIATVDNNERIVQDVSTAIRLFRGEAIFDKQRGMPYFEAILGYKPNDSLIESLMKELAATVPDVQTIDLTDVLFQNRDYIANALITKES